MMLRADITEEERRELKRHALDSDMSLERFVGYVLRDYLRHAVDDQTPDEQEVSP